jgi:predicted Zn-dependent peptidase
MPHTRSVAISAYVGVGSRYEADDQAGVSHFIEHMVFKGTERRPDPVDISAQIESTGGMINAGTEQELTVYWCKVAQPYFSESMDLLVDMLRNSLFRQDDIEKERHVIHEELAMINDYPSARVDSLIDEMLWPDHPLGRDIGGSHESVDVIDQDMLLEHMGGYYTPSNTVISVAGSVPHTDVVAEVERLSWDWPDGVTSAPAPVVSHQQQSQLRLEYKKTEQLHLSIALPGLALDDPDIYALDLLSVILGEGMSSRLFVELRENRGLAYDVHSGVSHFRDTGAFIITAGVDPASAYEAVPAILEQVAAVRDSIDEREVDRAKQLVAGRMMLRMEDTRAVSAWMGSQQMVRGAILDVDDVVERVKAVTTEDLRRVASQNLVDDHLNLAVVGPCRGRKRLSKLLKL